MGKEIALKANRANFDKALSVTVKHQGKTITFTPATLPPMKSEKELESGQIIGQLYTQIKGDESNLPPGTYNLYLKKVGSDWHCYAEARSKVIGEAKRAVVEIIESKVDDKSEKPTFIPKGWAWKKYGTIKITADETVLFEKKICIEIAF